jgi:hypothetical protein
MLLPIFIFGFVFAVGSYEKRKHNPTNLPGTGTKPMGVMVGHGAPALLPYKKNVPIMQVQPQVEAAWTPTAKPAGQKQLPPVGYCAGVRSVEGYYA